jgi:hypothetical protein
MKNGEMDFIFREIVLKLRAWDSIVERWNLFVAR